MWILILHQASEQLWTEDEQADVMVKLSTFDEDSIKQACVDVIAQVFETDPFIPEIVDSPGATSREV
jgi:hypothetical protein